MSSGYPGIGKRVVDVLVAGAVAALVSPVALVIALLIRAEDGGPALFRQRRIGRHGREFTMLKFRSMGVGAASVPSASALVDTLPITRVGRLLRRTNIDEIPQLWNVLRGDMSLVGPRPALPSQTTLVALRNEFGASALRPGLTGLAQINAYDGMSEDEKAAWDGKYVTSVSVRGDVSIIARTFQYLLKPPPRY